MAKWWKHTFNKFYNWESDDTFISTGDKYLSSYNIEPVLRPRWLQLSELIVKVYAMTTTGEILQMVTIPGSRRVDISFSEVHLNWLPKQLTIGWSWYCHAWFLYDSTGALKIIVFDQTKYWNCNDDISTATGTVHPWSVTGVVTAVVNSNNTLVYSIGSILYQLSMAGTVVTSSVLMTSLPFGTNVKKLYFYNDLLYVFTQLWADTIIYQCSYDWSKYSINYTHVKKEVSIYDMAWSGANMYWISNLWLYQSSGVESKRIKNQLLSNIARCSIYKDDLLYIVHSGDVYRYGTDLPWFPKAFVKLYTHSSGIVALEWQFFMESRTGGESDLLAFGTRYPNTGEIVTIPYDASVLWAEKSIDVIDFAYELKTGKTGASIQIQCMTNLMELVNTANYVNILTLSTLGNDTMRCRIDKKEILTALWSNNPDFQYIRFKIILNWWDPDGSSLARYTPKVYQDIMISGTFLNDAEIYL